MDSANEPYHGRKIFIPSLDLLKEMRTAKLISAENSESDFEFDEADSVEESLDYSYNDEKLHWCRNNDLLYSQLTAPSTKWVLEPLLETEFTFVRSPTASKIPSIFMHPGFYRSENMGMVSGIGALATILLSVELQCSWRRKVMAVKRDSNVKRSFAEFISLLDASEDAVERALQNLVTALAYSLNVQCKCHGSKQFVVGGLLAQSRFVIHGRTDVTFQNDDGKVILSTEVKKCRRFPLTHTWYHKSRGVQTFGNLFMFSSVKAPVLLITPEQFKLFYLVEKEGEAPNIFTFPSGHNVKCIGEDVRVEGLVDVLSICLLRSAPWRDPDDESMRSPRVRAMDPQPTHTPGSEERFRALRDENETGSGRNMEFSIRRLENDLTDENCSAAANVADAKPTELKVLNFPWAEVTILSADGLNISENDEDLDVDDI
jgi:hypothetical protein